MRKGLAAVTSAHLVIDAGSLGGKSVGDVKYSNGQATASQLTINAGGTAQIVTVGDTTYAKLPAGRNTTGKPWVIVSNDSNNEFVRALSSQVSLVKAATSLPAIADAVGTATSISDKGTTPQGHRLRAAARSRRRSATRISAARCAISARTRCRSRSSSTSPSRPTQIKIAVKLGSSSFPIVIDVSKFNAPLTITAPPADQVAQVSTPQQPEPDTKDWTWVLDRPCPDCGFDASSVSASDVADRLRAATRSAG